MKLLKNWPPNSPDLSPIENVWSMVQNLVDEYNLANKEDLIKTVRKAWRKLSQDYIYDSVLNFDACLKVCVASNGEMVTKW